MKMSKKKKTSIVLIVFLCFLLFSLTGSVSASGGWRSPLWSGTATLDSAWVWRCSITGTTWGGMTNAFRSDTTFEHFNFLHVSGNVSAWLRNFGGSGSENVTRTTATGPSGTNTFFLGRHIAAAAGGRVISEGGGLAIVEPRNTLPTAQIQAPSSATVGSVVSIRCESSDTGAAAGITSRSWRITPNTNWTPSLSGTGGNITFWATGNYTIRLTVTDLHGVSREDTHVISVTSGGGGNTPPSARINAPSSSGVGSSVNIQCVSTDSNGHITGRTWSISPSWGWSPALSGNGGNVTFSSTGSYTIILRVTDNHGATSETQHLININQGSGGGGGLVADIRGPSSGRVGERLTFTCHSTGGSITSRAFGYWCPVEQWDISFGQWNGVAHGFFDFPGTYEVVLSIRDNQGRTAEDSLWITIEDANVQPVSRIGVNGVVGTTPVTVHRGPGSVDVLIQCASFDDDGIISGRDWTITPSTGFTGSLVDNTSGTTLSFNTPGTYTVTLAVTDNQGARQTQTRNIVVNNNPITLITGPTTAVTGRTIALACGSTDSNGSISSRTWSVSPTSGQTNTLSGTGGNLTFTVPGTYTIGLTVTDNQGATGTDTHVITVTAANVPPTASISAPTTAVTGASTAITGTATDTDGTIVLRAWTVTPSTGFTGSLSGTGGVLVFTIAGTYSIGFTVTDNQGATHTASHTITVTNPIPTALITGPTTALTGGTIVLACGSTDSNGTISSRTWSVNPIAGQTNALSGTGGDITFAAAGTYTITLNVTDNHGATSVDTHVVTVTFPPKYIIRLSLTNAPGSPPETNAILPVFFPQTIPVDVNAGFIKDLNIETFGATQIRITIENISGVRQQFYLAGSDSPRTRATLVPVAGVSIFSFRLNPDIPPNMVLDVVIELLSTNPAIINTSFGDNAFRVIGSLNNVRTRINLVN